MVNFGLNVRLSSVNLHLKTCNQTTAFLEEKEAALEIDAVGKKW